jgi:hypothetical protein|tara:strand:+ start:762 stop:1709 length:948 start_codon:yes stop_codon:yes gene_type:complete
MKIEWGDAILTINDSLQENIWSENVLKPEISNQLYEIATEFFVGLHLDSDLEDVTFTGSLANYNWTKYSDIDLHLLVDFSNIDADLELVREYFNAKTSLWNKTHDIFVRGYEIELYVQDINEDHHSTGVYSIKNNEWIAEPARVEPKINTDMVKRKINSFIDMIERVEDRYDDKDFEKSHSMAASLARKIKKFRQAGLEEKGEYSNENLTFKYLRNKGHIRTLYDTRNKSYDKMMSIEGDYEKKFKIYSSQGAKPEATGFVGLNEEEKFQKRVKKRHSRMKKRLIGLGGQRNVPPFTKKPNYRRGKSSPGGFGGS